jgi:LemA protein
MVVILIIAGCLAALVIFLYNRLIRDRNRVDAAWSDIDVQLQRRHDLIPQLVKSVQHYAGYERATLEAIAALRTEAMSITDVNEIDARGAKEHELSQQLQRLIAVAEDYPDLKANENFLKLQSELVETEDYLQFARRFYNGSVRELNTRIETVPGNFVADWFGFTQRSFFQKASDDAAAVPLVDLGSIE